MSISPVQFARETIGLALSSIPRVWPWLIVYVVGYVVLILYQRTDPFSSTPVFTRFAVELVLIGALMVAMFRAAGLGRAGEGFNRGTLRMVIALALLLLALALVTFFLGLFLMILSVVLVIISGHDPTQVDPTNTTASIEALHASGAIWVLYAVAGIGLLGLLWMQLRLLCMGPATLDRGQIMIFKTWGWTRRHVGVLLAMAVLSLVVLIPGVLVSGQLSAALDMSSDAVRYASNEAWVYQRHTIYSAVEALFGLPTLLVLNSASVVAYRHFAPAPGDEEDQPTTLES